VIGFEVDHGQLDYVRLAADEAIRRVLAGEHSLVFHPGCGTSMLVADIAAWLAICAGVASIALGGSVPVTSAFAVMLGHVWGALAEPLRLLAQRLVTVSPLTLPAQVLRVERFHERGETRFAVVVDMHWRATTGGVVIPGIG
jgi:hypothetical protein